jgi:valyl-tRNA synthetase
MCEFLHFFRVPPLIFFPRCQTPDLERFFPSTILETGLDTLYFWVAPMILLGLHLTGTMPFKEVFCHGMVSDCYGRKMGKSLGNGVDPLDVIEGLSLEALHKKVSQGDWDQSQIEKVNAGHKRDYPNGIPRCGADALRFALCASTQGSTCRGSLPL